jgi:uncharacterized protein (TIGR00369 family)
MRIWKRASSVELLAGVNTNTAVDHFGIEFLEVGDDYMVARLPVNSNSIGQDGSLHGGVAVVLAETLASCGAACATPPDYLVVGLDVSANHLQRVTSGWVTATARPVQIGNADQLWRVEIRNDDGELVCVSQITMAILKPR